MSGAGEAFDAMSGGAPRVSFAASASVSAFTSTSPPSAPPSSPPQEAALSTARTASGTPRTLSARTRRRLDCPSYRIGGGVEAARLAHLRGHDIAVELNWSADEDQEMSMVIEDTVAHPKPLTATLATINAAVPDRSLEAIAERWLTMNRRDGIMCPDASDLTVAIRAIRCAATSPSPDRTRSPSPTAPAVQPSPLLQLPPELWQHVFSKLDGRGLSRAAQACRAGYGLAKPRLDALEVTDVVEWLVDVVVSYGSAKPGLHELGMARIVDAVESGWWPPRQGMHLDSDSDDDDDYDRWYGMDLWDREPDGDCIICGAAGVAGGKCLSCGAPVEPWDGSFHYDFGWVDGPRADEPE